jgi:LPPG:FO 2-phospho-L-lactate transferase
VGASKLLLGLAKVLDPAELTIIANTGDDIELHGLHVSPDLDIITYTLAGAVEERQGWGIAGDTFHTLQALGRYGRETWFNLGDRDLATHLHRTALLRAGRTLAEAAESIRHAWGVAARILPATNDRVESRVVTDAGAVHFQEYLVRDRGAGAVRGIVLAGLERARPAPGVLEAIAAADGIVVCPSNPIISIGPILGVPGVREAVRAAGAPAVAVSPVVAGASLKGPTDKMLAGLGHEVSALGVARLYADILDGFILDRQDAAHRPAIEALGLRAWTAQTVMQTREDKIDLAKVVLSALDELRA